MKKASLLIALLCTYSFFFSLPVFSFAYEEVSQKISTALINEGFENLIVKADGKIVIISYENRIYRNESEAAAEVIKIAIPYLNRNENLILIPQFRNIPMLSIEIPFNLYEEIQNKKISPSSVEEIKVSMDTAPYWKQIESIPLKNSAKFKADIIVSPQIKARFGNFDKVVETQINLAPEVKTSFWKGMSFSAQGILPLHNELDSIGNYIRPGLVTINQLVRLPFNTFASGTLGYFTENRLGADLEIKNYAFNGRVSFGASLGYTQEAFYRKGVWYYSDEKVFTHLTSVSYRNPQLDLNFKVSYGKFLIQDKGWRFDVSRQFGKTEIGFYVTHTNFGNNGGFNFSIPIFPSKYWKPETIRVRPAELFPWEYRYRFSENLKMYNTGNRVDNLLKKFDPGYFKKELIVFLKKYKI